MTISPEPARGRGTRLGFAIVLLAVITGAFAAGAAWRAATAPAGRDSAGIPRSGVTAAATPMAGRGVQAGAAGPAGTAGPGGQGAAPTTGGDAPVASVSPSSGPEAAAPAIDPAAFVAPPLAQPLPTIVQVTRTGADAGAAWLLDSSSAPPLLLAPAGAPVTDWRLNRPNQRAVRGYAGMVSVLPGDKIDLHLAGTDPTARLDIFRMGVGDAHHLETVRNVPVSDAPDASPDPATGRVEEQWPVSLWLDVNAGWRPGVYLAKATGSSGGQSYILFLVRSRRPAALTVVLPLMTYQAYNHEGGANLYGWDGGPHARAYEVSFDRPYRSQYGAGQFFWLDFPLVVWLEDHGYEPAYMTDLDLARDPVLAEGIQTLLFSGHSEYWTGGLRDAVQTAAGHGTNLVFLGANDAYWQIRLQPDRAGVEDRTIVCYKDAALDPVAAQDPADATVEFTDPAVNRPFSELSGMVYGGIVHDPVPLVLGPALSTFAPDLGIASGDQLPGIVGGEVDVPKQPFGGVLLGSASVAVGPAQTQLTTGATLWVNPDGGRAFAAGTLGWSWGLDPRYAAALPGFRADAFDQLNARILAWAGTQPSVPVAAVPAPRPAPKPVPVTHVEVVAGAFSSPVPALALVERITRLGIPGFVVEEETGGSHPRYEVERTVSTPAIAARLGHWLAGDQIPATTETDRGTTR